MRLVWSCASIFLVLALAHRDARAQAWVSDPGSLGFGLDYNFGKSSKVLAGEAADFPDAGVTTHQVVLSAEYTPIRRLAISAALPMIAIKFDGDQALYAHQRADGTAAEYDDGDLHTTLTDLRFGARYAVLEEPFALAPHVAATIPVADYETIGNANGGRHLKALHVGISAGYIIGLATYVHAFYEFSFVERDKRSIFTEYHNQNRTDVAVTIGHKLLDYRLDIHADANVRRTHGGVSFDDFAMLEPDELTFHDSILDEDMLLVGGGASYQVSNQVALSLSGRVFVSGQNTQNASLAAFGVSWTPM